jgi:hypothetical protein
MNRITARPSATGLAGVVMLVVAIALACAPRLREMGWRWR